MSCRRRHFYISDYSRSLVWANMSFHLLKWNKIFLEYSSITPRVKLLPCRLGVAHVPLMPVCHTDLIVMVVMILPLNTAFVVFAIPQASLGISNVLKQTGLTFFRSNGQSTTPLLTNASKRLGWLWRKIMELVNVVTLGFNCQSSDDIQSVSRNVWI